MCIRDRVTMGHGAHWALPATGLSRGYLPGTSDVAAAYPLSVHRFGKNSISLLQRLHDHVVRFSGSDRTLDCWRPLRLPHRAVVWPELASLLWRSPLWNSALRGQLAASRLVCCAGSHQGRLEPRLALEVLDSRECSLKTPVSGRVYPMNP